MMCRFVAYQGHPVLLADLLYRPLHSLVRQSMSAEQMSQPFNGDGFGIGWYPEALRPFPCVVKTATPAWASRNIESVALATVSDVVFGHVRAASPGLAVQESNSHPFQHGRFLFMHNGTVRGFKRIRRALQQSLSDWAFESIEGTTDSEHAFALLLDSIGEPEADLTAAQLRAALVKSIERLRALARAASVTQAMALNLAVTDGRSTVAARYAHDIPQGPATLYYSAGLRYRCDGDDGDMEAVIDGAPGVVMVASEPVTRRAEDWLPIPPNHTLTIGPDRLPRLEAIPC